MVVLPAGIKHEHCKFQLVSWRGVDVSGHGCSFIKKLLGLGLVRQAILCSPGLAKLLLLMLGFFTGPFRPVIFEPVCAPVNANV